LVAKRHNRIRAAFFERLVAAGKAKKVALVALARKLSTILNATAPRGTTWDEKRAARA
jgi:transposase